ncbi:MAG: hypothetical protein AAF658_03275 [Myxococcota bacterium]
MRYVLLSVVVGVLVACGDDSTTTAETPTTASENSNASANSNSSGSANSNNANGNSNAADANGNSNANDNASGQLLELGAACTDAADCESGVCESGTCLGALEGCDLDDVERAPGGVGWADSYSVDGRCYCDTTFDHNIGPIVVDTPNGPMTVSEVCAAIGPGPGSDGHPIFNDVQCGHGPPNDAGDEDWCPGRVDEGEGGCCTAGARWVFD